jgi:hypothetical protein
MRFAIPAIALRSAAPAFVALGLLAMHAPSAATADAGNDEARAGTAPSAGHAIASATATPATGGKKTVIAAFSSMMPGSAPSAPWRLQTFSKVPRQTEYTLVADAGSTVLRVTAERAAASLIRPLPRDLSATLSTTPGSSATLRWRWKPLSAPDRSSLGDKNADDWGARLYVLFEPPPASLDFGERLGLALARALYGDELPARGLCYVWLPDGQAGAMAPNAYTDRLAMIVVDTAAAGDWRTIERDLAADYQAAFGAPLAPLSALAVSADSDNGGGIAEVLVGDIVLDFTPAPTKR